MGENTFHVKCYEATTQHLEKRAYTSKRQHAALHSLG